jgi:hypothetical protein
MEPIDKIFEHLKESNLTMIGYNNQDELIKDEFISKLPHIEIFEFDSSFSVMSALNRTIRGKKIDSVLDGECFSTADFVIVDLGNFDPPKSENDGISWVSRSVSEFVGSMRKELIGTEYRLIILSPVTKPTSFLTGDIPSFRGGSRSVYMADLVYVIEGRKINIVKNRFDGDNITISLDGLKDYKYICSYENNN